MITREPNTEYILSLSYGKDSIACLEAIKRLGYPLDRIIHAEVWATDTIPADLPPMVEFKAYADKIIKEKYGIEVKHICAVRGVRNLPTKSNSMNGLTQEKTKTESMDSLTHSERGVMAISNSLPYGFPISIGRGNWCTQLKQRVFKQRHCARRKEKYRAVPWNSI